METLIRISDRHTLITGPVDGSVAYFGLRANAHQLVTGAGIRAVRRRIKLAALLHDSVVLEAGAYEVTAGPGGSVPLYFPGPLEEMCRPLPTRWQTPTQRSLKDEVGSNRLIDSGFGEYRQLSDGTVASFPAYYEGDEAFPDPDLRFNTFTLGGADETEEEDGPYYSDAFDQDDESFEAWESREPWWNVIDADLARGPASLRWFATFYPFERELPESLKNVVLAFVEPDYGSLGTAIHELMGADVDDPMLMARWTDEPVRRAIVRGALVDFVRSAVHGMAFHADPYHLPLIDARIARGDAQTVMGERAMSAIAPYDLSWLEVAELRKQAGWREYRAVLHDIETEVLSESAALSGIDARILRKYGDALAAAEGKRPSVRTRVTVGAISFAVGEIAGLATTGLPLLGGLTGTAAGEAIAEAASRQSRPRWLAAHHSLRNAR